MAKSRRNSRVTDQKTLDLFAALHRIPALRS
jgi:hypothetical protein